jgi:hypothetical protein
MYTSTSGSVEFLLGWGGGVVEEVRNGDGRRRKRKMYKELNQQSFKLNYNKPSNKRQFYYNSVLKNKLFS